MRKTLVVVALIVLLDPAAALAQDGSASSSSGPLRMASCGRRGPAAPRWADARCPSPSPASSWW